MGPNGRSVRNIDAGSTVTRALARCWIRMRPTCRACRPACTPGDSRDCGTGARSCAYVTFTRCSMITSTDRAASHPERCEAVVALTPAQLRGANRRMKIKRELEERLHDELATGEDP